MDLSRRAKNLVSDPTSRFFHPLLFNSYRIWSSRCLGKSETRSRLVFGKNISDHLKLPRLKSLTPILSFSPLISLWLYRESFQSTCLRFLQLPTELPSLELLINWVTWSQPLLPKSKPRVVNLWEPRTRSVLFWVNARMEEPFLITPRCQVSFWEWFVSIFFSSLFGVKNTKGEFLESAIAMEFRSS